MLSLLMVALIFASPVCSQPGFISLDCGGTENYTDDAGIQWMPDDPYINSGQKFNLSNAAVGGEGSRQLTSLRRFPEKRKSCYQLTPVQIGTKYLLRGTFFNGNHDNLSSPPQFDLLLDSDVWYSFSFSDPNELVVQKEIILMAKFDPTNVCLARNNLSIGSPIISSLELRPLNHNMYWPVNRDFSLLRIVYSNYGPQGSSDLRYPDDQFDRLWYPSSLDFPTITTSMEVSMGVAYDQPPSLVMQGAVTSNPNSPSVISIPLQQSARYGNLYISVYFAELKADLNATSLREFDFFLDDKKLNSDPIQPKYLQSSNVSVRVPYGITNSMAFCFQATNRSTLPPIGNALEWYRQSSQNQQGTFTKDVEAINIVQQQINYSYVGDPCLPTQHSWDWLTSSNDISPRIVILNLASRGLTGSIQAKISSLTALEIIDLSDNNLNEAIPESLASLTNLKKVDLENNDLTGTEPAALESKKNLNLSLSGNVHLCYEGHNFCRRKSTKKGLIIGLVVAGGVIALFIVCCIAVVIIRKNFRRSEDAESLVAPYSQIVIEAISREYSYEEVKEMTNDFSTEIGRGGYGPVYYGKLNIGRELAVKRSSETSTQGTHEFKTEAVLLLKAHHKNLVSLVGYCCEGAHRILIYEFMPNGNLHQLLYGNLLLCFYSYVTVII
ncbi:hypothetical protein SUGI_0419210 [Cryptomeria japonica]|nr:hypothetical protein SUGI_0419210 [Cryptomeria japonica]